MLCLRVSKQTDTKTPVLPVLLWIDLTLKLFGLPKLESARFLIWNLLDIHQYRQLSPLYIDIVEIPYIGELTSSYTLRFNFNGNKDLLFLSYF